MEMTALCCYPRKDVFEGSAYVVLKIRHQPFRRECKVAGRMLQSLSEKGEEIIIRPPEKNE
jgi:hypothetical protein